MAINNNSVFCLQSVRGGISESAKQLFTEMEDLVSVSSNSKNMRDTIAVLNKNNTMTVPSIGTYCSDLTFANDANNIDKVHEIAEGLAEMQHRLPNVSSTQSTIALRFAEHIKQLYQNIYGASFNDKDDYCYHQSLKLEPRKSQLAPSVLLSNDQLGNILDPTVIDGEGMAKLLFSSFRRISSSGPVPQAESGLPSFQRSQTSISRSAGSKLTKQSRNKTLSNL